MVGSELRLCREAVREWEPLRGASAPDMHAPLRGAFVLSHGSMGCARELAYPWLRSPAPPGQDKKTAYSSSLILAIHRESMLLT